MAEQTDKFRVACVQVTATPDLPGNLAQAEAGVREAAAKGGQFVTLPEAFDYLVPTAGEMHAYAAPEGAHEAARLISRLSTELGIWILAGSVSARANDGAVVNRSLLAGPKIQVAARYDKIHLFDVDLPDGEVSRESDFYRAGSSAVVADTPWGKVGLTICYDVRFPGLFRTLASAGAQMICCPAAFSSFTGPLHWKTLLRARAIETGSFIIAPAQCGLHYGERRSHGHSMIIDPWGEVLAEAGDRPEVITADIDLSVSAAFRASIPSLTSGRDFTLSAVAM